MARTTSSMVREGLDSLVNLDTARAHAVLKRDSQVDRIHKQMHVTLRTLMEEDPRTVERAISTLSVSRYLERIADLATNVAEDVIFLVEGEGDRHQPPLIPAMTNPESPRAALPGFPSQAQEET